MGKAKQTRKFAVTKKIISPKDTRVQANAEKTKQKVAAKKQKEQTLKHVEQANSALFFQYNTQLGPPYQVLVDTNFINFSIRYVVRASEGLSIVLNLFVLTFARISPTVTTERNWT